MAESILMERSLQGIAGEALKQIVESCTITLLGTLWMPPARLWLASEDVD